MVASTLDLFLVLCLASVVSACSRRHLQGGFWTGIIPVAVIAIDLMLVVVKMKG